MNELLIKASGMEGKEDGTELVWWCNSWLTAP